MIELKFSSNESEAHRRLKLQAVAYLRRLGFGEDEIFLEYPTEYGKVDVAGIKPNLKVAVECGNMGGGNYTSVCGLGFRTVLGRRKALLKYFDKLLLFLYLKNSVSYSNNYGFKRKIFEDDLLRRNRLEVLAERKIQEAQKQKPQDMFLDGLSYLASERNLGTTTEAKV
jgi:hypothetical protein